jgi:hypothetical protein
MRWRRGDDSFLPSVGRTEGAEPVYLTGRHDYAHCAECKAIAAFEHRPVGPRPPAPKRPATKRREPDCGWTDEDAAHFIRTSHIDYGSPPYSFDKINHYALLAG